MLRQHVASAHTFRAFVLRWGDGGLLHHASLRVCERGTEAPRLIALNVAQVQGNGMFSSIEQHSDGGPSAPAHNDTCIAFESRATLFSENGNTNPLSWSHLYVFVAH
jgi:hypothetical protein